MKILTLNFLSCAVKACKSSSASFPLHPKDCELESAEVAPNPKLLFNILPRIDWNALVITASEVCTIYFPRFYPNLFVSVHSLALKLPPLLVHQEEHIPAYLNAEDPSLTHYHQLGFTTLKTTPPTPEELETDEKMMGDLHTLLLETQIMEGSLVCGNCGHVFKIKEGIANFLLPNHLV